MKRFFQRKFRDDRFALTTLQNPDIAVRTYAELVQAAQRDRERQQRASQIPATQPLAVSDAPDSIPTTEIRVNDAFTAPDPDPAALAPLDSANLDPTNPDSTNDDAQQLLDSLVADVVTAGSSVPSLSLDDDELTAPPTPKPRRKAKSKSRRKSNLRPSSAAPAQDPAFDEDDSPELSFVERHARKCSVCRHPYRQGIDESFPHWRSPQTIMNCFGIKTETTIYHHAHAFNFFALRNRNLQSAFANIIEDVDTCHFTGSEMLDAVRALAHLTEDGRWIHPASKSEFMYSMQRLPAGAVLPAAQAALSAHTNSLPAVAGLPTGQVGEEILIASPPNIKKRCKPLKTILTYPG
jgi:hypothetical protein